MNIARSLVKIHHNNVGKSFHRKFRFSSLNLNSTQSTQPQTVEEKFGFEDIKILERQERRKAAIPPFIKDTFVSTFNFDMLAYPEILNKEESEALDKRVSAIENVFSNPDYTVEEGRKILKATNMYAAPVSLTKNGLAMNHTESLRYLDVISDINLSRQLSDHWVGLEVLKHGLLSDDYQQIIGDLITGDQTITLCLKEPFPERITQTDLRTTAALDEQGIWRVNGEKVCHTADGYLLVLCCIEAERLGLFLVHPGVTGVSYKDGRVSFRRAPATQLDQASEVQMAKTLGQGRLHSATIIRGLLKRAAIACGEFARSKVRAGKPLSETSLVRRTVGDALVDIYASESTDYFTAGLLDGYLNPDAEVEMAMCRNFIAKAAPLRLNELLAVFCQENEDLCDEFTRQMNQLTVYNDNADNVDVFIALNGIHHAGKMMAEEIKNMRNPVFNPGFIIKKIIANRHQEKDAPNMNLRLYEYVHPSLKPASEHLEYCTLRMRYAVETILSRHGQEVGEHQTELVRLAEAATGILTMTATLARASRAYCIGLRNAELEMKLAPTFVTKTREKVKQLILEIEDGEYLNLDHFKLSFGRRFLDTKSVEVEKPTARVFW